MSASLADSAAALPAWRTHGSRLAARSLSQAGSLTSYHCNNGVMRARSSGKSGLALTRRASFRAGSV